MESQKKFVKTLVPKFGLIFVFLALLSLTAGNVVHAETGSIAKANSYPIDGSTYDTVNSLIYQTTGVNPNTTVSVSIDGCKPITMSYQGVRNETAQNDTVSRNWFTWEATIAPITTPGKHSFQFFSNYQVWQDADQYWAEFNAYSEIKSFTISGFLSAPSESPLPTSTDSSYILALLAVSPMAGLLIFVSRFSRKQSRSKLVSSG
jgi:hypothetical protein